MKHRVLTTALCLSACLAAAFAGRKKQAEWPPSFEGAQAHTYQRIGNVELKLWIFTPEGHSQDDARPAAVFFFGGGWVGGTPKQFEPHARYLASRGMVAAVADYRVRSRQGATPFDCVQDGKAAVRWLRAHAKKLGIDPDRIAAGGGSAGGHVAAATGNVPGLEAEGQDLSISSKPNALLLFNPVYDNGPQGYGHDRLKDRWKEISPMHHIAAGAPPTVVFLGTKDKLIPVTTAREYQKRMEQAGSRSELHLYEDQPHGFFNKGRNGDRHYRLTVRAMDQFLVSLGWLRGEPTITADP